MKSIYVSKNLSIRGYFSKPKGVREQILLGNTGLKPGGYIMYVPSVLEFINSTFCARSVILCFFVDVRINKD
jgi:hypothetical protein